MDTHYFTSIVFMQIWWPGTCLVTMVNVLCMKMQARHLSTVYSYLKIFDPTGTKVPMVRQKFFDETKCVTTINSNAKICYTEIQSYLECPNTLINGTIQRLPRALENFTSKNREISQRSLQKTIKNYRTA